MQFLCEEDDSLIDLAEVFEHVGNGGGIGRGWWLPLALTEALVLTLVLVEDRNHGRPCPRLGDRAEPGIEVGEVLRLLLGTPARSKAFQFGPRGRRCCVQKCCSDVRPMPTRPPSLQNKSCSTQCRSTRYVLPQHYAFHADEAAVAAQPRLQRSTPQQCGSNAAAVRIQCRWRCHRCIDEAAAINAAAIGSQSCSKLGLSQQQPCMNSAAICLPRR